MTIQFYQMKVKKEKDSILKSNLPTIIILIKKCVKLLVV